MRVVEISRPGGPEVLRVADRPKPDPSSAEVLIRVHAAGVNRADIMQRQGTYPPPPGASDILGLEVSGTIAAIGEAVTGWDIGENVCALLTGGGYAQYVTVPAAQVLPIPSNWNFVEAASLPETMFTVYDNLITRGHFRQGETILTHGGTSGIGTTAIMVAKAFGARFIAATAGSDEKCAACRELGADLAINYKTTDFVIETMNATQNGGVNVVLDVVGGDYVARDLDVLALDGRIICIATQRGRMAELDIGKLLYRRATVLGSSLRPRSIDEKGAIAHKLRERVWPLLPARDPIRPVIDSTFPLERAAEAHQRLESSAHIGKIVLTM